MRKRSGQVHSRESSATLQLTVSLLYHIIRLMIDVRFNVRYHIYDIRMLYSKTKLRI